MTTQTALRNHPGMWLDAAAAASLDRLEAAKGRYNLTDAGRTVAEQQGLINRWYQGGVYNRPPYLYKPYEPAASGPHVGGHAIDTSEISRFKAESAPYGWRQDVASDPVHFVYHPELDTTAGGAPVAGSDQVTKDRQNWLNTSRGEKLTVDGVEGPETRAAYKRYQQFLAQYGYTGAIDGIWGAGTQAAHAKYYTAFTAPKAPTVGAWAGLQKMLRALYGYTGAIDNIPGPGTWSAMQRFLAAQWGYTGPIDGVASTGGNTWKAVQRWLKARYGYTGPIDGIAGAGTLAALERAGAANGAAF